MSMAPVSIVSTGVAQDAIRNEANTAQRRLEESITTSGTRVARALADEDTPRSGSIAGRSVQKRRTLRPHTLVAPLTDSDSRHDFTAVFREHAPLVHRALRRLGVSEGDAPDVLQEVFVVVHRKLGGFEGRSQLRTWIYGIAMRVAADHRKSAYVRRERPTDDLPERAGSAPELKELERRERVAMLDRALGSLTDEKRAVLVLFELEELPMKEVAVALECPLMTAYARLYAAREELKKAYVRQGGTAS
jgi:RNA polymerase sigma-70 factor (ECF subfamily)